MKGVPRGWLRSGALAACCSQLHAPLWTEPPAGSCSLPRVEQVLQRHAWGQPRHLWDRQELGKQLYGLQGHSPVGMRWTPWTPHPCPCSAAPCSARRPTEANETAWGVMQDMAL